MSATVVVPVFGAADRLASCLASLAEHTPAGTPVLLCDDASPQEAIRPMLSAFAQQGHGLDVRVVVREQNLGFVGNVNAAFAETPSDVILLNSDTEVSAGWYTRLLECAASDARIATITPFSNNAEICSFPQFCRNQSPPGRADVAMIATAMGRLVPVYPQLPTAVGFCMFVRRACLDAIGDLDAATFGRGYGEENDFCLRASRHGWIHVLCDNSYVVHHGGASFSAVGLAPGGENLARLLARYPDYNACIADFVSRDPLAPVRAQVLAALPEDVRARIMSNP